MSENMLKNVLALIPKLKDLNSENTNSEGIDSEKAKTGQAMFDFDAQDSIYNPMEKFVDRVFEKENTHSIILQDLFDPDGSHHQKDLFLKHFLQCVFAKDSTYNGLSVDDFDYENNVFIAREFCIKDYLKGDAGRIDIYIELTHKPCQQRYGIIIENKINGAGFQPDQLQRYHTAISNKLRLDTAGQESRIITVCLPKLKSTAIPTKTDNGTEIKCTVITPDELAWSLEEALAKCTNPSVSSVLASYIICLKNINKINSTMNNAEVLYNLLCKLNQVNSDQASANNDSDGPITIKEIESLVAAFELLPELYITKLENAIKEQFDESSNSNKMIKCKIGESYKGYLDVWDEDVYKETSQWLSIGADLHGVRIYLVSNAKDQGSRDKKAADIGYGLSSVSYGNTWYKPVKQGTENVLDEEKFRVSFNGTIPDEQKFDVIVGKIKNLLEKIEKHKGSNGENIRS